MAPLQAADIRRQVLDDILTRRTDGVLHITLNRPGKRNALTAPMYAAIADALESADTSEDVRAIVVDAAGPHFTAGNDVADFVSGAYDIRPGTPSRRFHECLHSVRKPMIAGVQGYTVGIGFTMLLHFDLVFVDDTARLSAPFCRLGLSPEVMSSALLRERIGLIQANAMFYLGKELSADDAVRLGLANEAVPSGQASQAAVAAARTIASLPRASVEQTRALVRSPFTTAADRLRAENEAFMRCLSDPETVAILKERTAPRVSKPKD